MGGHHFYEKCDHVFFHESSTFMKKGTGDDFRLMSRVLPRPLVLQGGKSFAQNTELNEADKLFENSKDDNLSALSSVFARMTCPPVKLGSRQDPRHAPPLTPPPDPMVHRVRKASIRRSTQHPLPVIHAILYVSP